MLWLWEVGLEVGKVGRRLGGIRADNEGEVLAREESCGLCHNGCIFGAGEEVLTAAVVEEICLADMDSNCDVSLGFGLRNEVIDPFLTVWDKLKELASFLQVKL